jgi:hypothetical protein
MKNKILKLIGLGLMTTFIAVCSSCSSDDMVIAPKLAAFGPNPALRGSTLTFTGTHLDQVVKVTFPNNVDVTEIEVVSDEKIKVTVPQSAQPGTITLTLDDGKTIVTRGSLTYTEPISVSSVSPNPVKAGQILTISGDYLNLIEKIIFNEDEEVFVVSDDFLSWSRERITLALPAKAKTGMLILTDLSDNPFELKYETVLNVVLPAVPAAGTFTNQKPGYTIIMTGTNLDLVKKVIMPNNNEVSFTVNETGTSIQIKLPADASDGKITMVPASGVVVDLANLEMAVPQVSSATPVSNLRSGNTITVVGSNMDLVTGVAFPNVTNVVVPANHDATSFTVVVPQGTRSGNMVLKTASTKDVNVAITTQKPALSSYNPTPAQAGSNMVLNGTNMDLVASVTFIENQTVSEFVTSAPSAITLKVPVYAETGKVVLTMANGETVDCPILAISKPAFCFIPDVTQLNTDIYSGNTVKVTVQNANKLTEVRVNGITTQYIISGSTLYALIPGTVLGNATLKLISSNGDIEYAIKVKNLSLKETAIWEGMLDITWGDGGRVMLADTYFEDIDEGSVLKLYFTQKDAWGQAQINNGSWSVIPFAELNNDGYLKTDGPMINNDKSVSSVELVLTDAILNNIRTHKSQGNGIIIQGSDWIFTKVTLITKLAAPPAEIVVMEEPHTVGWNGEGEGGAFRVYKENLSALQATSKLKFYYTPTGGGDAQLKVQDANWGAITINDPNFNSQWGILALDPAASYFEWQMNQETVNKIMNTNDGWSTTAMVIAGQNVVITKITIIN